jgi:hypothetical protein
MALISGLTACKPSSEESPPQKETRSEASRNSGERKSASVASEAVVTKARSIQARTTEDNFELESDIRAVNDADLRELIARLADTSSAPGDKAVYESALSELARRFPEEALAHFPPEEIDEPGGGLMRVIAQLSSTEPEMLTSWFADNMDAIPMAYRRGLIDGCLQCMSQAHPDVAWRFFNSLQPGSVERGYHLQFIFETYGEESPDEALAVARENLSEDELAWALSSIAAGMDDDDEAFRLLDSLGDGIHPENAYTGRLGTLLTEDPKAAKQRLESLNDRMLQGVMAYGHGHDSLVSRLGRDDPEFLMKLLERIPITGRTEDVYGQAVRGVAENRPELAEALIDSVPEGSLKMAMVKSQYEVALRQDAAGALQRAAGLVDESERSVALATVGEFAGKQGLEKTLAMAEGLEGEGRDAFLEAALPRCVEDAPREMATRLSDGGFALESGKKKKLMGEVAFALGEGHSAFAKDWLTQLPPENQSDAMHAISAAMARNEVSGLETWLEEMPRDENWRSGVQVLISNFKDADPARAAKWKTQLDKQQ